MSTNEEIFDMIQDCQNRERKLTAWECDFIASIDEQVGRGRGLSPKQAETLERIWNEVTA